MTFEPQDKPHPDPQPRSSLHRVNHPCLHPDWIDPHAYDIVKTLQDAGYPTFLVGGCVRDLLLGIHPKDFDIATMAKPNEVRRYISGAYVIGKRFRLVLVKRGPQQYEVATFRRQLPEELTLNGGHPIEDNIFGTPEEDASRRDFRLNGLFYDPIQDELIDYTQGLEDVQARWIEMIGDPQSRLEEDPIRILRALRLAHKIGFTLSPDLRQAMHDKAVCLPNTVLPRRREEFLKIMRLKYPAIALAEAYDLGVLKHSLPTLHDFLSDPERFETFFGHLDRYADQIFDPGDNIQLFGCVIAALYASLTKGKADGPAPTMKKLLDDPIFDQLMRLELGMFKYEQASVARSFQLLPLLRKFDEYSRKGQEKLFQLLKQDGITVALMMARADRWLHPRLMLGWKQTFEDFQPHMAGLEKQKIQRKRDARRRRHQKRPPRNSSRPERLDTGTQKS